ncbi:MAG: hypothetical protein ACTHMX_15355, partial [Thermomicrobiales bacterium]
MREPSIAGDAGMQEKQARAMTDVANGHAAGNAASGRTLSDDIYFLVGILGEAIQAVAGRDAFELEEAARALA